MHFVEIIIINVWVFLVFVFEQEPLFIRRVCVCVSVLLFVSWAAIRNPHLHDVTMIREEKNPIISNSMCTSVNSCLLFKLFPVAGLYCGIREVEQQQQQRNKKQKTRERERKISNKNKNADLNCSLK